jgi:hypothetical protein
MGDKIMARLVLFVVMVGAGVLVLGMAQAAVSGRLGRNPVAGIRLPVTMASDSACLTAHQAEKPPTQWAGWCAIAFALPSVLPVSLPIALTSIFIGAAGLLVFVLSAAAVASRAVRAQADGD